ncbi:hypothetical protein GGF41_004011 [Coemansia sp. RSA 2531]|nr:hypothetical protein GGF41_004011 [Coemansia sp. RSA 2531]
MYSSKIDNCCRSARLSASVGVLACITLLLLLTADPLLRCSSGMRAIAAAPNSSLICHAAWSMTCCARRACVIRCPSCLSPVAATAGTGNCCSFAMLVLGAGTGDDPAWRRYPTSDPSLPYTGCSLAASRSCRSRSACCRCLSACSRSSSASPW